MFFLYIYLFIFNRNPDENCIFATGTETATDVIDTELDLNEFVFYDSEQVTIKYLIKADVIFE